MPDFKSFPVFAESGQIGRVLASARYLDDRAQKTILLTNGKELNVPAEALEVRRDGSFFLRGASRLLNGMSGASPTDAAQTETSKSDTPSAPETVPHIAETQSFPPPASSVGVPSTATSALPHIPVEALFQSGYEIETVPINKVVDGPVEERHDGDTLVLPVLEEVWVVEKKLYLRQEIRITKRKIQVSQAQIIEKSSIA